MGVGAGLYMCDVVVKSSRSLSHLLMSSCMSSNVEFSNVISISSGADIFSFASEVTETNIFLKTIV